jgi:hypothetical protein
MIGLRYPREQVEEMIEGVANMVLGISGIDESWVYQDIFAEGQVEEARNILLSVGRKRLGEPDKQALSQIAPIGEFDSLNLLLDRIPDAQNWRDLLGSLGASETLTEHRRMLIELAHSSNAL